MKRLRLKNEVKRLRLKTLAGGANGNNDTVYETVKKPKGFFGEDWKDYWGGMPEFVCEEQKLFAKISVCFRNQEDLDRFAKLIGQRLNRRSQSTWFPEIKFEDHMARYVDKENQ